MISALARGAQALDEPRYADAARGAASFVRREMWDESRRVLLRRYREGSGVDGFLDDYAFLCLAMLDLYETDFDARDLAFAVTLAERAIALFEDRGQGGFFSTGEGGRDLILRLKDDYDGAEPSGNSAMAIALLRLARMTGREDFRAAAQRTLEAFGEKLRLAGAGLPQMLVALDLALGKPMEIVLAGPRSDSFKAMLAAIRRRFLPRAVMVRAEDMHLDMPAIGGEATAYVCENYACKLPATSVDALGEQLQ
jgi:uncharacterized protein YyaL (SSP411 family)